MSRPRPRPRPRAVGFLRGLDPPVACGVVGVGSFDGLRTGRRVQSGALPLPPSPTAVSGSSAKPLSGTSSSHSPESRGTARGDGTQQAHRACASTFRDLLAWHSGTPGSLECAKSPISPLLSLKVAAVGQLEAVLDSSRKKGESGPQRRRSAQQWVQQSAASEAAMARRLSWGSTR